MIQKNKSNKIFITLFSISLFLMAIIYSNHLQSFAEVCGDWQYSTEFVGDEIGIKIEKYNGTDSILEIPSTISGEPVMVIDDNAFAQSPIVTQVSVPSTVKYIKSRSFYGCSNLEIVDMQPGLIAIDAFAFAQCPKLKKIAIPEGVVYIGQGICYDCPSLITASLPSSLITIDGNA